MSMLYREVLEVERQLGMYGWIVKYSDEYLKIDIRGDVFYLPYSHIIDIGSDSVVRYCKARYTLRWSRNNENTK